MFVQSCSQKPHSRHSLRSAIRRWVDFIRFFWENGWFDLAEAKLSSVMGYSFLLKICREGFLIDYENYFEERSGNNVNK